MSSLSEMFSEADFKLPIPLTEEEIIQKQAEYFGIKSKIGSENMKLVVAKADHKERTAPLKKKMDGLDKMIQDGFEVRSIRAIEYVNEDSATMDYIDPNDSGVVLHSRPLTPTERQQYKIKFGRSRRKQDQEQVF
jgi:hypothetical protein